MVPAIVASLLPLLSGVVLILSPLSFYVILTQRFTFFYQRQIFNAADDFVDNLNAVQCTFLIFDCIPDFDFQFHDTFGIIVGI